MIYRIIKFVNKIKVPVAIFFGLLLLIHIGNDIIDQRIDQKEQQRKEAIRQAADTYAPFYNDMDKVFKIEEDEVPYSDDFVIGEKEKYLIESHNDMIEEAQYAYTIDRGGSGTLNEIAAYSVKKGIKEKIPGWVKRAFKVIRSI